MSLSHLSIYSVADSENSDAREAPIAQRAVPQPTVARLDRTNANAVLFLQCMILINTVYLGSPATGMAKPRSALTEPRLYRGQLP